VARLHNERSGYPTQKPEGLLERIINASSNPGDWVADFFCGSGTTAVVAARLGRNFIASDVSLRAVHTTRGRLVQAVSPAFALLILIRSKPLENNDDLSNAVRLSSDGQVVKLETGKVGEIDYWEVDPAWDGKVFHSAFQAVRPRRKGGVVESFKIPASTSGLPICARVVDIHGNTCWLKT
jgi:hypothetical protein